MSVRKNITISDEMAKYFEEKSKATGVSQASLMVLAIAEYLDQKKAIESVSTMIEQMKKLQDGQKK